VVITQSKALGWVHYQNFDDAQAGSTLFLVMPPPRALPTIYHSHGAFTLDVKSLLNEKNLGGILGGTQC